MPAYVQRIFLVLMLLFPLALQAAGPELTWYGHSAFKIKTPSGKILLIDPWIGNPANKHAKADLAKLNKVDLILITHGHFDHVGDSAAIARKTGAHLVATFDLGSSLAKYAGYPPAQMGMDTLGNTGGTLDLLKGEVKVTFVPAVHSSGVMDADKTPHYGGNPGGFLITIRNGPTLYHTGDTDVFTDMALIPQIHKVDVMLACIGDHFTMGPERAAEAVRLIKPGRVIPMHYGTFPVLTGTPDAFAKALKQRHINIPMRVMRIDETLAL